MNKQLGVAAVFLAAAIQFLPVAPPKSNPPSDPARSFNTVMKPPPPIPQILDRACTDCHSNETRWPWYSHVAPLSWPIRTHVADGRKQMNLSEWLRPGESKFSDWNDFEKICVTVREGSMPLPSYLWLHPEAELAAADRQTVCEWVDQAISAGQ